ncbi:hypothetical protein AX17_007451 [Amanita inopinata Kibby_2008]|nr:hypothetical protein AX17_007451 [Amanita inopinata Kibby_2008]
MTSAGILVPTQRERFSPPPLEAGTSNGTNVKNFGGDSQVSNSNAVSSTTPPPSNITSMSGQSLYSSLAVDSSQSTTVTEVSANKNEEMLMTSQQFSSMHVVTVHSEDEQKLDPRFVGRLGKGMIDGHSDMMLNAHVGPPPPSPPASVERDMVNDDGFMHVDEVREGREQVGELQESLHPGLRLVTPKPQREEDYDFPLPTLSTEQRSESPTHSVSLSPPRIYQHSFADTKDSLSTLQLPASTSSSPLPPSPVLGSGPYMAPLAAPTSPTAGLQPAAISIPNKMSSLSVPQGAYLHPPPATQGLQQRPARRNTTGSSPLDAVVTQVAVARGHTTSASRFVSAVDDDAVISSEGLHASQELASEIQRAAEQIRRERQSKRKKQQAQQAQHNAVEAALTRSETRRSVGSGKDDVVLVGNLIAEGHVNYVLMYNMLTGIRIGVSRCQAKMKRALATEDFKAAHKMSFDIIGNELTPSAKYDFKFKDYAPWVFRSLREDVFHLDPADYLLSLTAKYILSELGSPGKSGSFFYFSRDYRFIIKTIRHAEHKFLLSILEKYYKHVQSNPHTLLSRFYGLHRVKLPRGRKIHFVIMNNLFPPHRDIHETYDLKGSTVGREYSEEKARQNPRAVLKDLNWINRGKMLELGPEKRALLTEQLRRDAEFLKTVNVMDYSLLVGIHNMRRGNRDNVRKNTLKVFSPDIPRTHRKSGSTKGMPADPALVRRAMRSSETKRLGEGRNSIRLPDEHTGGDDRAHFIFYQDEGGLRATDESNEPLDAIYYLGIIDILTPWNTLKKLEGIWKGLSADRHKISPVHPSEYSQRFFSFMKAIMRGGEGGAKFKAE